MSRMLVLLTLTLFGSSSALAWTNATSYLVKQQIHAACDGPGKISPQAVIEKDLTGDEKKDLIISHNGITCSSGQSSGLCGIRACSVLIYVRQGPLLVLKKEILSIDVSTGTGAVPAIKLVSHNFDNVVLRWNGSAFK